MQRLQAYQFELMPNGQQQRNMRRFAGACRFVFNKSLAWQKEQYASDSTILVYPNDRNQRGTTSRECED